MGAAPFSFVSGGFQRLFPYFFHCRNEFLFGRNIDNSHRCKRNINWNVLCPTFILFAIVNTLIKRIDVHNSKKDESGTKHVPIDIYFTAVGIINIPTEKELIAAMEEIREKPLKSA